MAGLSVLMGSVAMTAAWHSSQVGTGLMEGRISTVVFAISVTLALLLGMEMIRQLYAEIAYRRWISRPE